MNILYYIPTLNQEGGGIRQYAIALLKILSRDSENKYFILHNVQDSQVIDIIKNKENFYLIPANVGKERWYESKISDFVKVYNFIGQTGAREWKNLNWSYLQRICNKYKIDLVHCPFQFVPYSNVKTIWTLHDVQELHFPEYFAPKERERRSRAWVDYLNRGNHIVVSYDHIKKDILKFFKINSHDITVCLLQMNNLWFSNYDDKLIDFEYLSRYNFPFLLYPANTWQHKNHVGLIEALKTLKDKGYSEIKIICTGHKNEYYFKELEPLIEKYKLNDAILFLGVLDEKKLFSLYKRAKGVIIPTKYEAGSFPLIESIMLEVPVICSNVTSLPKTIGDKQFLFNPNSINEIASLIIELFYNKEFLDKNKCNLVKQKEILNKKDDAFGILQNLYIHVMQNSGND